jgi:hypothetical protein
MAGDFVRDFLYRDEDFRGGIILRAEIAFAGMSMQTSQFEVRQIIIQNYSK